MTIVRKMQVRMNKKLTALVAGGAIVVVVAAGLLSKKQSKGLEPQDQEIFSPNVPKEVDAPTPQVKKLVLKELKVDWKRTVIIKGPIRDENIDQVVEYMTNLEENSAEPIYVLIDSPGGSILAGERLISAMESAKGPVYTVCTGLCASMAAVLHAYGTKRYAQNRAILMYHDAAGGFEGNFARMKSQFTLVQRKVDKVDEYICYRAHIDCKEFRNKKLNETWLDAEDAMSMGFVDAVVKTLGNPLVQALPINANPQGFEEDDSDVKKLGDSIKNVQ